MSETCPSPTHTARDYRRNRTPHGIPPCRCAEGRGAHARLRRLEREIGYQPSNGGRRVIATENGTVAIVTPTERRCLDALLLDGGDGYTIARRAGVSYNHGKRCVTSVQHALGYSTRQELVVALLRGRAFYREVGSPSDSEMLPTTEPAKRRKGA